MIIGTNLLLFEALEYLEEMRFNKYENYLELKKLK